MRTLEATDKFIRSRRARGVTSETIRWYVNILKRYERMYPELPTVPDFIEDFLASCTAGDERRHGYYRALRALYKFLEKRKYYPDNPIKYIDAPRRTKKLPKPITLDEVAQLIFYPHRARIKAILYFLIDTGARPGELIGLTPSHLSITPIGCMARITGKTGTRIVPILPETYEALMKFLPFGCSKGRLRVLITKAFRDARVEGSAINLRHTFATYWDGDEKVLQYILGHSHLATTMIYRALRLSKMAEQHRLYSPLKMVIGITQRINV